MRFLLPSSFLLAFAILFAQAPDPVSRTAPPSVVRKSVRATDGQTIEGQVLSEGMLDLQLRTDDKRIRLLRKAGDRYRVVTSQTDWPTYHGDPSGNRYTRLT